MYKVLVSASHFDTLCKDAWDFFQSNGLEVIYNPDKLFPAYTTDEIRELANREEIVAALIGMDDYRDEEKYKLLPNLKAVAKFGVGVDNIDKDFAEKYGVKVLNAPGQNSNAVAELTVGLIIDVFRHVVPLHKDMEKGLWTRHIGSELKGKTIGLLGFGAIAKLVAKKLQNFDVTIQAFDLYPDEKAAKELGVTMVSQEEIITTSDVVSVHIPVTSETYHLFDKEVISQMKDGAYLINTARGGLVNIEDLADALLSYKIAGAALDAFEVEPLPLESKIFKCKNIVLTPHTGAETKESYYNVSMKTARDIVCVVKQD